MQYKFNITHKIKNIFEKLLNTTLRKKILFLMAALITLTPTILIAILGFTYYYLGIRSLFNDKIEHTLSETVKIAELYLQEHKDGIKIGILAIASDIDRNYTILIDSPELFEPFLNKQAELRNLSEAMVFTHDKIIGKTFLSFSLAFEDIPEALLQESENGEIIILATNNDDKVRALLKLNNFVDTYLLVGRYVDKTIINYLNTSQGSAFQYQALLKDISRIQTKLQITFLIAAILLCTTAVLVALKITTKIVKPINQLVAATERIQQQDFTARISVPKYEVKDEIVILAKAFNQMTERLAKQTHELVQVNNIINERHRFIETVLKEISTAVIVINLEGIITLCNQAAYALLKHFKKEIIGVHYANIIDEISDLLTKSLHIPNQIIQDNITVENNGQKMYLFIRVGAQVNNENTLESYIVTFDDMTTLVMAQKSAAWADVARRIAHEVKNPLTPINLAAEQLNRKFKNEIKSDTQTFAKYIQTIISHVEDIENIVEDFVQFAKISSPKFGIYDLSKIIEQTVFSQQTTSPEVEYILDTLPNNLYIKCDKTQIAQVLINLFKNAVEAIDNKKATTKDFLGCIKIRCSISSSAFYAFGDQLQGDAWMQHSNISSFSEDSKSTPQLELSKDLIAIVTVMDNGEGIPENILPNITEPYVTTKPKGNGLGLSIVKRIIEDHGGKIQFIALPKGAEIQFSLPLLNNYQENNHAANDDENNNSKL